MGKKLLLGCSGFLVLVAVGVAVLIALNRDASDVDASDIAMATLGKTLQEEFGWEPRVEFACALPVVGNAPCVLDNDAVSRKVTLTFTNYELMKEIAPEEQARRIAVISFHTSDFVKKANELQVIFGITELGEFASISRTSNYSFSREALAAAVAMETPHEPGGSDAAGE